MAQTTPPTITPSPQTPQRGVKATFSNAVDAFVTWMSNAVAQFGAVATNCYNNAVDAFNSAVASAASAAASLAYANTAAAAAAAALATANAAPWQSGVTVAQDACVIAPADRRTYRRKTASGSGTTDPSLDFTNYVLVSFGPVPFIHVRDEKVLGTGGGASAVGTTYTRTLNTVKGNTIPGASLSANEVTLPAGTYDVLARAPCRSSINKAWLTAGGTTLLAGGNSESGIALIMGQITLATTQAISISHYVNANATDGLGVATPAGGIEVYTEVIFRKMN